MNLHGDERRHHLSPLMVGAEPSSDKPVTGADIVFQLVFLHRKLVY